MATHRYPRIAFFLRLAHGGKAMDIMARARTLEAALGLPAWSVARNATSRTMAELEAAEGAQDISPEWFSDKDWGLSEAVLKGARAVLRSDSGELTAEEVATNMMFGLSSGGGRRSDVFGDLGEKMRSQILSGRATPRGLTSSVFAWAKNRALDVVRKQKRRPDVVNDEALQGVSTMDVIDSSPNEVMLSLISGPAGQKFRAWIYETIQRKATEVQKVIVEVSLDHMARTGDWPSAASIRDRIIELKGSDISVNKINQHRRKVEQLLASEMENNPKILDWAERYLDLADLGYGGGTLRAAERVALRASAASRVAHRFLEARGYQPTDDEASDVALALWQKDVGQGAIKALKSFPQARVLTSWAVDSRSDAVRVSVELPPFDFANEMDKYDRMESSEFRSTRLSDWVTKGLQKFMGRGRVTSPSGIWISQDYIDAQQVRPDGTMWVIEITPHMGR